MANRSANLSPGSLALSSDRNGLRLPRADQAAHIIPRLRCIAAALLTSAGLISAGSLQPREAQAARTIIVGPGGAYATITAGLGAASPGDTIQVRAGRYREKVNIAKSITLTAYGNGQVWIDGDCLRANGIAINANDVTVRGIGVKRTTGAGILIDGRNSVVSQRATVQGNTVQDFNCDDAGLQADAGIAAWYAGAGHRILSNRITRRVEIAGTQRGYGDGIWFKSSSTHPSGGGHAITDNIITGGWDGIGGEVEDDLRGSFDRDTTIARNTVRDCSDDGIQVEGGNQNIRVTNNQVTECGVGISFAPNLTGPLTIDTNTISSSTPGTLGVLACFKVGDGGAGTAYLTSNVCTMGNPPGGGEGGDGIKQTNPSLASIVSSGNRFNVSRYIIEFAGTPGVGSSFDTDCLSTSDPTRFIKWAGVRYMSIDAFRKATGQEKHSLAPPC
jgi:hypothetical protein